MIIVALTILCVQAALAIPISADVATDMPLPFKRTMQLGATGSDVKIAQAFLERVGHSFSETSGDFDAETEKAVKAFQSSEGLAVDGVIGERTATLLLEKGSNDGFVDDKTTPESLGYKYKIQVFVHANRSIETTAHLFSGNNTLMHSFIVRAHGQAAHESHPFPDFNNTDPGLNEFTSNGNTPTGLGECDLNTPESDVKSFGPYNINRLVRGLKGNMKVLLPDIRSGILLHTGEWDGWTPSEYMPNSHGCIHAHPEDVKRISEILINDLGVVANKNPFAAGAAAGVGKDDYPYKCQGLLSVTKLD